MKVMNNKIKEYVEKNYKRLYQGKPLIIRESDTAYFISTNIDESPLILNKNVGS